MTSRHALVFLLAKSIYKVHIFSTQMEWTAPPPLPIEKARKGTQVKKVIFNLTEEQDEKLGNLAKKMGLSKSEALRRSIEMYGIIKEAQEEGSVFSKRTKTGEESIVEIIG